MMKQAEFVAGYYTQKGFVADEIPVFHGYFTRKGGASEGDFSALNCGPGSGEDMNIVQQNRNLVAREASVDPARLVSVHQEHGVNCVTVKEPWPLDFRPKADAMVTDVQGIALGILTADCAPVLLWGLNAENQPIIGAAHAGWKGALGGVLESTLKSMELLGVSKELVRACVGPCIGRTSYEVSVEFSEPFLEEHDESGRFFHAGEKAGHLMFDLAGYCAWRLFRSGLRSIALMDKDTYVLEDVFYSYRRATHRGEQSYGRQISVIAIRQP